jgi:hypothetical protein
MDKVTLAYIAGLFDGEGCVTWNQTETAFITNCYPHHLSEIQRIFKCGRLVFHDMRKGKQRTSYRLLFYGQNARKFISKIRPYLREKGYQADIMMNIRGTPSKSALRKSLIQELSRLKRIDYGPA